MTFLKFELLFLSAALMLGVFSACDKRCEDCNTPQGSYAKGVFVVNEGPFGGSGTISWYNPETGEVRDSIYEKANNGARLGQFVQSLTFFNGKGYIVVNGANRVVVVDGETFKFIDTIGGLAQPRFFQPVSSSIAFVSQWGADGLSGSLAKVDLDFTNVLKTIPTGHGPEKMLYFDQTRQLYVANSGGYGVDSTIAYFQVDDENSFQKKVISGQQNPACFSRNSLGGYAPWNVICKGNYLDAASSGWIGRPFVDPGNSSVIPKGSDDLVTGPDGYDYFTSGTAIYRVDTDGGVVKLFDQAAYGLAVHPLTGNLYCLDAKDFSSAGEVVIRKPDGTVVGSFRAGVAPGEMVFR